MTDKSGAACLSGAQGKIRALVAALLFALLAPGAARADSRVDAKRHFRDGMALIAAGQLERGIAELKQAYAIKPHPDVLYDIAKAEVDRGNIPEALNYFRQYVATDPEDKEQVQNVIARLQAAISAPGAQAQASGAAPAAAASGQNVDVQKLLTQLQALIAQQQGQPGPAAKPPAIASKDKPATPAAPAEEEMFEAETISARSRATAREIAQELGGSHAEAATAEDIFEEQVVTASARSSSEAKTPASLTIISEDEIRMSGAATVPEILRRVPGIDVAEMNPSDTNISIRGFNRRLANKVLVLVDGRSVYQDFLGATLWPLLDVAVPDISRIEVIRGPGSALYGANAFAGVVNIITKVGQRSSEARVFMQGGDHGTFAGGVSAGGRTGKLSYRTTIAYDHADKWMQEATPGLSPQFSQPDRSREVERADVAATYDLGSAQVLTGAGYDNLALEIVSLGSLRTFGNTGQSGFARLEIDSGQTKVKAFWNALRLNSGPEYWPQGVRSLSANVRSDVVDVSSQTGFDFKAAGQHHLNLGAGYRFKSVRWGYLAARPDGTPWQENHFNLFLQEEWQPTRKFSVILSYRLDREPLLDQANVTAGGLVHSPRGTLLFEVTPEQVLRFTVGSAFREPTFLESYVDLLTPVPTQPSMGVRFQGSTSLRPEQILQAELGYRGRIGQFQPDLVVYAERVQNLITDGAVRAQDPATDPATGQTVIGSTGFENEPGSFFGVGAEAGGKWSPADGVDLGLNYSFEKMFVCSAAGPGSGCSRDSTIRNQVSATLANTAQHKINGTVLWRTRANFDLGIDVHYVSSVTWFEKSFDINQQGGVLLQPYPIGAYTMINGRLGYRWFQDKLDTGVAFYNILGDEHREHPFGNRIGRRVLFTAAASF